MRRILVGRVLLLSTALVTIPPAMKVVMRDFEVVAEEQAIDSLPPTAPVCRLKGVWRGHGGAQFGEILAKGSRDGSMSFLVSGAEDDRTPADSLGYRFRHVSGDLPRGLVLPPGVYLAHAVRDEQSLWFHWNDTATWNQDSIAFQIAVVAVDRAGNVGPRSNVVKVTHDGDLEEFRQQWARKTEAFLQRQKALADSVYNYE